MIKAKLINDNKYQAITRNGDPYYDSPNTPPQSSNTPPFHLSNNHNNK